ncbi:hypothetical protein [Paenibacillus sp.]|nr:hypothetical protein [Paenibacillus sp.]
MTRQKGAPPIEVLLWRFILSDQMPKLLVMGQKGQTYPVLV